jgi:hypothetical protein
MIKAISNWFGNNLAYLSNLFGIIGIILILFFGLFYIPQSIQDTRAAKMYNAQRDVEQSVKELIYSDTSASIREIKFLIEAKEINMNERFPLTISEVLTLAQQSFMQDKFLSLIERKEYIKELEDLKSSLPKAAETTQRKNTGNWTTTTIVASLSVIISILLASLGVFTLLKRHKKEVETQEELNNEIEQTEIALAIQKHYAYEMENHFISILKKIEGLHIMERPESSDTGVDVHFVYKNKEYFVKFKFLTHSKVGLPTIRQLFNYVADQNAEIWLIYNTGLTALVKQEIKNVNQKNGAEPFKAVRVTTGDEFGNITKQLLSLK